MRPTVLLVLFATFASSLHALEIHFHPSFVELVSDGVSQRVRPGELVEVPVADSMMEMEVSEQSPRTVELRSRGRCEFKVFGASSVLEDSGKMTISMDPGTKKLDIGWIKGEMKTPPSSFDKSAAAAFFAASSEDFMRPMDFPGVRPFGYTDILEGRGSMVSEGDWRRLPPLPERRRQADPYPRRPPQDYPDDIGGSADWRTFEEDHSDLPPLSLPPPTRERRPLAPTQVLMLAPSTPTKSEPYPEPLSSPAPDAEDPAPEGVQRDIDAEDDLPTQEGEGSPESTAPSPEEAVVSEPVSTSPAPSDLEGDLTPATAVDPAAKEKAAPAPESTSPSPSTPPPDKTVGQKTGGESSAPIPTSGGSRVQPGPKNAPTLTSRPASSSPRPGPSGPTLYDRIVAQEEKQKEVIDLLREVSQQMQEMKLGATPAPSPTPSPTLPNSQAASRKDKAPTSPSPAPPQTPGKPVASERSRLDAEVTLPPPTPPVNPTPALIPALPRSSSSPNAVQPIGSSAVPAPSLPVNLGAGAKPSPPQSQSRSQNQRVLVDPSSSSSSGSGRSASGYTPSAQTTEDWDFTLEAVGTLK